MKILTVISANTPMGGTIAKLRALILGSKHEHIIYFYCYKKNYEQALCFNKFYEDNSIKVHYGVHDRNILAHSKHISSIAKEESAHIIHFYFNVEQLTAPLVHLMYPNAKLVRSCVGYIPLSYIRRIMMLPCMKSVGNFIFISNYIKQRFENDFSIIKKSNSKIIYNGPIYTKKLTINCDAKKNLLFVGGLNTAKNAIFLPDIINSLVNKYERKDIILSVIGDGPQKRDIEELIKRYNISTNIKLMGYSKEVATYLENASLYIHPATNEGFGISVVEAMYMHCPCLVSNISAPQEIVDESCGYVLPIDDPDLWAEAIIKLIDDDDLRLRMGEAAYKRATQMFSLDSFIKKHDTFYESI